MSDIARYIDAEAVKIKVQRYLIPNTNDDGTVSVEDAERWFLRLLEETPTADVVEVVRCKDCRHGSKCTDGYYTCRGGHRLAHDEDDFCSYGEGKSDENNS